jgi:hypothetical protein
MIIRDSAGTNLTRSYAKTLDGGLIQAAEESLATGGAKEADFATEAEAKAAHTKLRTYVNSTGHGLRAKVVQGDQGNAVLEFRVTDKKRDVSRKNIV